MNISIELLISEINAFAVGVLVAIIASSVLLILYRFLAGRARPFGRDLLGTTTAAVAGALAATTATLVSDTGGVGITVTDAAVNNMIAAGAAIVLLFAGLALARQIAGSRAIQPVGTDVIPLGIADTLGFVCVIFFGLVLSST